jgi:hypothetical protein
MFIFNMGKHRVVAATRKYGINADLKIVMGGSGLEGKRVCVSATPEGVYNSDRLCKHPR